MQKNSFHEEIFLNEFHSHISSFSDLFSCLQVPANACINSRWTMITSLDSHLASLLLVLNAFSYKFSIFITCLGQWRKLKFPQPKSIHCFHVFSQVKNWFTQFSVRIYWDRSLVAFISLHSQLGFIHSIVTY